MQKNVLGYLCCPACHAEFHLEPRSFSGSHINSGDLSCTSCRYSFPVFHGRPLLVEQNRIREWRAPVDEVLDPGGSLPTEGALSMKRLARIGVDEAIRIVRSHGSHDAPLRTTESCSAGIPQCLDGQARYRMGNGWMRCRDRESRFLDSLVNTSEAVRNYVETAISYKARTVLDIASGGGSGISCIVNASDSFERVFATERDLKCLWVIQNKFARLGRSGKCEAVGADVRRLPFPDSSVDLITSLMALQEINGIEEVLTEINRVLVHGGRYVAIYKSVPETYGALPLEDYQRFAREAGLFVGHNDFISTAATRGLVPEVIRTFVDERITRIVSVLNKP